MPAFSVKKPLTIFVAALAIVVLGVVAYTRMTPDLLPNMDLPYVVVITTVPGASPESVETKVTKPLEQSMAMLNEIKGVTSTSQDSVSVVMLEFENGVNMDTTSVDIQESITMLEGQWDDTVGTPYVLKINPSMLPVMVAAISYDDKDMQQISDFVDETLESKLGGITGVASVDISGTVEQEAHVILNEEKLDEVSQRLQRAIEKEIDKNASELRKAKAEIEDAKSAMAAAEKKAIGGVIDGAVDAVENGLNTLRTERENMQQQVQKMQGLAAEMAETEAQLLPVRAEIALLEAEESPDEAQQQRLEELHEQENQLAAREAELRAELAVYSVTPEDVEQRIAELKNSLEKVSETIDSLADGGLDDLSGKLTNGVVSALDGVTQMTAGAVQIQMALSQIDQGLDAIADARKEAKEQANMSDTMNINMIAALLTAQDFSMPAGYIDDEEGIAYMVSVGDKITDQESLEQLVLLDLGMDDMEPICLGDVADVFILDNSAEIYAKLNGSNGIIATFTKQSNYATAEVSDNLMSRFEKLEQEYEGLHFVPLMDQGDYIHLIVSTILSSLLWGALFSVVVLFLFLRDWRPTLITLVSIPLSVVFALVLMYFTGVTINMISLSGLSVAVGMLVDNSVVVIENIYRLRAKGASVVQAAISGTQQVLGAITASTLTTVCVFTPIVFVEGLTRELFTDLALTMCYALMASLLVALTLVPAMSSGLLRREYVPKKGLLDRVYPAYRKAIEWSLGHKAVVLLASVALLLLSCFGVLKQGFIFMPEIDMNMVNLTVTMPEDCSREEAVELADEVSRRALTVENVDTVGAMMSSGGSMDMMSSEGGDYDVTMYITMPEGASGKEAGKAIEELCADMACEVGASGAMDSMMSMMTGSGVSVTVYTEDMEDLQSTAKMLAKRMEGVEGIAEASDGLDEATEAIHVSIDRYKAMEHGMTVAQIYMQIAGNLTESVTSADMEWKEQSVGVVIETSEDSRLTREELPDMVLKPESGDEFRLGDVAEIERTVSLNRIVRSEQRRCVTVTGTLEEGHNITLVTADVQKAVDALELPAGVTIEYDGENEMIMDSMRQLVLMMLLGIVLVYFIMVAQFQSLLSPFIVMFTIPLAFTGGFLALLLARIELSVVSMIGFVMLVGIIVNNGIVLVDYINQQRLAGMERREAIIDAGVTRLRPILMTSLTTILGLIVMALAKNAGTALMQPVALVCIGGLLYATLMTLFVVPCMYDTFNKKELRKVKEEDLVILQD